jgi:hypothetical protein
MQDHPVLKISPHMWRAGEGASGPKRTNKKAQPEMWLCHFSRDSQRKKAVSSSIRIKKASWSKPNEFLRYTKDTRRLMPPTQLLWPKLRVSWPVTSPCFLAVCLYFHTCTGKRPRLTRGENAHLFPVVSELGTAIKAHHIRSRLRCSITTALSPFAGLGETDAFVPAPEQSVKNRHNLLPPVALDFEALRSSATFGSYWGPISCPPNREARHLRTC